MKAIELRGITWNHSRALPPLVAAAQRFEELHPEVRIIWDKRSLDAFGHAGLEPLAAAYDLLIVDHPMLGEAHREGLLLDMRSITNSDVREQLAADALGPCLDSYFYQDALYAFPVDAAAPAASLRPDLFERYECEVPARWEEVLLLARKGVVRMPGFPADLFLNFMGLCVSMGGRIAVGDVLVGEAVALEAMERLRELAALMPESIFSLNPIALYEAMSSTDEFGYCPFAYTYSNYARPGFAKHTLLFAKSPERGPGQPLRTVLGGTGIAVSRHCSHAQQAAAFAAYVSGRECQTHIYGMCGGQPASRAAWQNDLLNAACNNFFRRTQSSIESAYVRPRYAGYIRLQQLAGLPLTDALRGRLTFREALERMMEHYRQSRNTQTAAGDA